MLPRIDLMHHHIASLALSFPTDWDDDIADAFGWGDDFGGLLGESADERPPLILPYTQSKIKYAITLYAGPPLTPDDDDLAVVVRYSTVPGDVMLPRSTGSTDHDFIRQISNVVPNAPIRVTVEYEFGPLAEADLWFPLPNRIQSQLGEPSSSPVIEVRGVRGAKLDAAGEHDAYEFTFDRTEDNDIVLFVEFQIDQRFDHQTPTQALERANAFSRDLIRW